MMTITIPYLEDVPFADGEKSHCLHNNDFVQATLQADDAAHENGYIMAKHKYSHYKGSPIFVAIVNKKIDQLQSELKNDPSSAHSKNHEDSTPLHVAASVGWQEGISELLKIASSPKSLNSQNRKGETPLYCAARAGHQSIVDLLLHKYNSDPTIKTHEERNVIHAACESPGCSDSLRMLVEKLKSTVTISDFVISEDKYGSFPFDLAIESGSIDCCQILLESGIHLTDKNKSERTWCSLILEHFAYSKTRKFLNEMFDSNISVPDKESNDASYTVEYNFRNISTSSNKDITENLINSDHESLLSHPLVETYINEKWKRIEHLVSARVIFSLLYVVLHSVYLILSFGASSSSTWNENDISHNIVKFLHVFLFVFIIVTYFIQFLANKFKFLTQWETYVNIIAAMCNFFVLISPRISLNERVKNPRDIQIAAISAFMSWTAFMMIMGQFMINIFPSIGISIMMLTHVAKSSIKFIIAFISLLIGFSVSFYILFTDIDEFKTFPRSFAMTLMMIVNGFENWSVSKNKDNSFEPDIMTELLKASFLLLYAFMASILMTNLLIGLVTDDMSDLKRQGRINRLSKQALYLDSYEDLLDYLNKKCNFFPKFIKDVTKNCWKSIIIAETKKFPETSKTSTNKNQEKVNRYAIERKKNDQGKYMNDDLKEMFIEFQSKYQDDQKENRRIVQAIQDHLQGCPHVPLSPRS